VGYLDYQFQRRSDWRSADRRRHALMSPERDATKAQRETICCEPWWRSACVSNVETSNGCCIINPSMA